MYKKLSKVVLNLKFRNKRNFKIITPCCSKSNKDGKFANYVDLGDSFGFCHSCGKSTLPPTQYIDEEGNYYKWDEVESKFVPSTLDLSYSKLGQLSDKHELKGMTTVEKVVFNPKYVENRLVERYMEVQPENNLLAYIGKTYGEKNKEFVKSLYYIGTSKKGGTIFWSINKLQKVQKAKVIFYDINGRRIHEKKAEVPFFK